MLSENIFIHTFQQNPTAMLIRNASTETILSANNKFLSLFGLKKKEIIGKTVNEIGLLANSEQFISIMNCSKQKAQFFIKDKKGEFKHIQYIRKIVKKNNSIIQFDLFYDTSQQYKKAQEIAKSEEFCRDLYNNALVGFYHIEKTTGILINCNTSFARTLGYKKPDDIIGINIKNHFEINEAWKKIIKKTNQSINLVIEHAILTKQGDIIWVSNHFRNPKHDNFIKGEITNITDKKRVEENITNNEIRFQSLIENSNDLIIVTNARGVCSYLSPSITKLLGYTVNPRVEVNIFDFLDKKSCKLLKGLLQSKSIKRSTQVVSVFHKNSTLRHYQFVISNLTNNPIINGFIINAFDITNQINAKNELVKALEKEQELSKLKTRFIESVTHEFRTPITNISLNLQLIKKYLSENELEKTHNNIQRIENAKDRLYALLNEFSIISKEQSGRLNFKPITINIHQLIDELLKQQSYLLLPNIKLNIEKGKNIKVSADETLLSHILSNLISNAINYSNDESPIDISIKHLNSVLIIIIQDNGIGIPNDEIPFLFDPYFRASNVNKIHGTGLGLSIVKKCIDLHNGRIEIESQLNKGTRISCEIPLNL